MRAAWNDRAELCGYVQFKKCTYIHTYIHTCIHTTGTRIGLGRAEGWRKSARNRKIAVDAPRGNGGDMAWVESGKNVEKKGLVQ